MTWPNEGCCRASQAATFCAVICPKSPCQAPCRQPALSGCWPWRPRRHSAAPWARRRSCRRQRRRTDGHGGPSHDGRSRRQLDFLPSLSGGFGDGPSAADRYHDGAVVAAIGKGITRLRNLLLLRRVGLVEGQRDVFTRERARGAAPAGVPEMSAPTGEAIRAAVERHGICGTPVTRRRASRTGSGSWLARSRWRTPWATALRVIPTEGSAHLAGNRSQVRRSAAQTPNFVAA